jgi:antitoxin component of RelBE/YafQ-DinJ toxin-antitoxin module
LFHATLHIFIGTRLKTRENTMAYVDEDFLNQLLNSKNLPLDKQELNKKITNDNLLKILQDKKNMASKLSTYRDKLRTLKSNARF